MRIYSVFIALLCTILILSTPFPLSGQNGVYNTVSGLYWCSNHSACIHEIGHKLDQEAQWPSKSREFADTLKIFILSESKYNSPSLFLYRLFSAPDLDLSETYARLFEWSDGKRENMPEAFRKFYDWNMAYTLIKRDGR